MNKSKQESVTSLVAEISARLDNIEDLTAWCIRADQRFKKGDRVRFTKRAERQGFKNRKGGKGGRVVSVGPTFTVTVQLDGYAKPREMHHKFFESA